jgi:hypothetical protein
MSDRRLNVKPALWGPLTWTVLHVFAESMPEILTDDEQADATNFFRSLTTMLPCLKCRKHLTELYDTGYFPEVDTRHNMKQSIFKLHNKVSKDLGKPILDDLPDLNILLGSRGSQVGLVKHSSGGELLWLFVYVIAAILILFVTYVLLRRNLFYA